MTGKIVAITEDERERIYELLEQDYRTNLDGGKLLEKFAPHPGPDTVEDEEPWKQ